MKRFWKDVTVEERDGGQARDHQLIGLGPIGGRAAGHDRGGFGPASAGGDLERGARADQGCFQIGGEGLGIGLNASPGMKQLRAQRFRPMGLAPSGERRRAVCRVNLSSTR